MQHGGSRCNMVAAVATRWQPLQHGGSRCNMVAAVATRWQPVAAWRQPLQHGGSRCNTVAAVATWWPASHDVNSGSVVKHTNRHGRVEPGAHSGGEQSLAAFYNGVACRSACSRTIATNGVAGFRRSNRYTASPSVPIIRTRCRRCNVASPCNAVTGRQL